MPARGVALHRSPADLQRIRLRALALLDCGVEAHAVAIRLEVDGNTVRRWLREMRQQLQSDAARAKAMLPPAR